MLKCQNGGGLSALLRFRPGFQSVRLNAPGSRGSIDGVEAGELVHVLFGPNNQNELPSGLYSYAAGNTSVTESG